MPASLLMTRTDQLAGRAAINPGNTYAQEFGLASHFDYARAIVLNDLTTPYTIEGLAMAPSAKRNDGAVAVDADDVPIPFVDAGFGNTGSFTDLADQPGVVGPAGSAVPGSVNAQVPNFFASDWVNVPSVERADAGKSSPLLFCMYKVAAGADGRGAAGLATDDYTNPAKWLSVDGERHLRSQRRSVNWFTNGNVWAGGTLSEQTIRAIIGIQTMSRVYGISLLTGGDSLAGGQGSILNANSWGHQACIDVSTPEKPVSHLNGGWAGQAWADTYARLKNQITLFRPSILMTFAMSLNGGGNDETKFATMRTQFADLVAHAKAAGVRVAATTYPPFALTGATEVLRTDYNDELRFRSGNGEFHLHDLDRCVRDEANPNVSQTAFRVNPGVDEHLNDAGHEAGALDPVYGAAKVLRDII